VVWCNSLTPTTQSRLRGSRPNSPGREEHVVVRMDKTGPCPWMRVRTTAGQGGVPFGMVITDSVPKMPVTAGPRQAGAGCCRCSSPQGGAGREQHHRYQIAALSAGTCLVLRRWGISARGARPAVGAPPRSGWRQSPAGARTLGNRLREDVGTRWRLPPRSRAGGSGRPGRRALGEPGLGPMRSL